jgi:hypothetical protein
MLEGKGLIKFSNPAEENIHYNCGEFMQSLIGFGVRLLEGLFAMGVIGSTVVLVLVLIEDLQTMFGRSSEVEH